MIYVGIDASSESCAISWTKDFKEFDIWNGQGIDSGSIIISLAEKYANEISTKDKMVFCIEKCTGGWKNAKLTNVIVNALITKIKKVFPRKNEIITVHPNSWRKSVYGFAKFADRDEGKRYAVKMAGEMYNIYEVKHDVAESLMLLKYLQLNYSRS